MTRSHIQLPPDGSGKAALAFAETESGTPAPNAGVRYIQAFVPVDVAGNPLPGGATEATLAAILTELGQKLEPGDLATLATAAKQDTLKASVDAVTAKLSSDPATQTTLAAVLTELSQKIEPGDLAALATGAKQDAGNTTLASILAKLSNDPATQTTLAAVLAKLSSDPATGAKQDAAQTRLNLLASEATLATLSGRIGTTTTTGSVAALLDAIRAAQPGQSVDPSDRAGRLLGHVTVDNFPTTQPVSGTVAVSNFPSTQAVSAASLPLPTGAATAANQATLIAKDFATETTLSSINDLLATPTGLPVDIQDASLAVTGPIGVTDNGGSLTVDGTVAVSNLPSTQAISAASLPLPSGAAQEHVTASSYHSTRLTDGATYIGSTGQRLHVSDGGVALSTDPTDRSGRLLGHVTVDNASLAVTGTFWQATQPVSATALPLPTGAATETTLAAVNTKLAGTLTVDTELSAAGPLALESTQSSVLSALQTAGGLVVNTELPAAAALADNLSRTQSAPVVGAALLLDDLTQLVRAKGDTTSGLWVQNKTGIFGLGPASGDGVAATSSVQVTPDLFNGTNWDRMRALRAADGTAGAGVLAAGMMFWDNVNSLARNVYAGLGDGANTSLIPILGSALYNGTTWDKMRSAAAAAGTTGTGLLGAGVLAHDGTNYQRLMTGAGMGDGLSGVNALGVANYVFDGTNWVRARQQAASGATGAVTGRMAVVPSTYLGFGDFWGPPIAAAAHGDAGSGSIMVTNGLWNGASVDRQRSNLDGTALASAARTGTTSSADISNFNGDGALVILRVSTITTAPSLVLTIEGKDPVSGVYYALNANPTAVAATGAFVYEIGEGASGAAGGGITQRTAGQLPRVFRVTVTHGNANSVTYSVGYTIITA